MYPQKKKYVPKQINFLKEGACMRVGKKQFILLFQYTRGDKGRSNERKKTTLGNPTHRVSRRDPGKLKVIDKGYVSLSQ